MEGINHKHNIEIEILTPLSIGAGAEKDWVRGIDFVVQNGKLYKLNLKKMVSEGISIDEIVLLFQKKDEKGIILKLGGKLDLVADFVIPYPIESDNDIKTFVKNQLSGNPIISGSSLKGSIRSILFNYLGSTTKDGKEVFGKPNDGDEFMRFIKISDAEFDNVSLVNTKIFNLQNKNGWIGGWKHGSSFTNSKYEATGFNTLYESLMPKQKGYATLMLSESVFNLFDKYGKAEMKMSKEKKPLLSNNTTKLFEIINNHTKCYLEKERDFFNKYHTDKSDEIIASIDNLLNQIPVDNNFCILKMSAGSGFHSITGDWQFKDFSINGIDTSKHVSRGLLNNQKSAKSRKIAIWGDNNFSLMGFVKISSVSEAVIQNIQNEKRLIAEEKRIAAENARLEAEKKAKQNEDFVNLVNEAKNYLKGGQIEMAKISVGKAKEIDANAITVQLLMKEIDAALILKNQENSNKLKEEADTLLNEGKYQEAISVYKTIQQNGVIDVSYKIDECNRKLQEAESMLTADITEKLTTSTLGAFAGSLKKWMKAHNDALSQEDEDKAFNVLQAHIANMKDVKGKKNELIKLLGDERGKQWLEKLNIL